MCPRRPVSPTIAYSLPSGPKRMTPPSWLPRSTPLVASSWSDAERDDAAVELELPAVPLEAVDAVAHQPDVGEVGAVDPGAALAPEQVDPAVAAELRMQRDPEQPPLRSGVHRQVEHHVAHLAAHDALDLAAGLLEHQHLVIAEERHRDRLVQPGHRRAHLQGGIEHLRTGGACPRPPARAPASPPRRGRTPVPPIVSSFSSASPPPLTGLGHPVLRSDPTEGSTPEKAVHH